MRERRVAERYAKAILQLADEKNKIDEVNADFELIEKIISLSREFVLLLRSPIININKKKKIFVDIFKNKVDELTLTFILLLINKNREKIIPEIISCYKELIDEKRGLVEANIVSVTPLTDYQSDMLKSKFESIVGKKVRMKFSNDPTLIGGFRVRIKDTVWDGSILHYFETMKEKII